MKYWIFKNGARLSLAGMMAFGLIFGISSCKKEDTPSSGSGSSNLRMHLTDAPGNFQQVNVDIREINIHTDANGWQSLALLNPGVYNLLDFRNGLDTLLTSSSVPSGRVSQVRLVLGSNNSVMVDSIVYPLQTPSAEQSGLKLNVQENFLPGITYDLWIDFDAGKSIVLTGNGTYILKPVIRVFNKATTGAIKADNEPDTAANLVRAISGVDTATAIPDSLGMWLIGGLNPGAYTLEYLSNGSIIKTSSGISVNAGSVNDLGKVNVP